MSWGSPGRNDLAVKVGPKVTEVLSEVLDLSNLIAVWVSAIRHPITGGATALGERGLFEYSAHSGRSIHTWLASTTNLGNRGGIQLQRMTKGVACKIRGLCLHQGPELQPIGAKWLTKDGEVEMKRF